MSAAAPGRAAGVVLLLLAGLAGGCGKSPARPDRAAAVEQPGTVVIGSVPAGAAVFREESERLGHTPLTLVRPGGTRLQLRLIKDGYSPRQLTAVFEPGRRLQLQVELHASQGELTISSGVLVGAEILVDGELRGRTPNRIGVSAGEEHTIEVRKSGMESYREKVTLRPGEQRRMMVVLMRAGSKVAMGVLELEVNAPAEVYLDNRPIGRTPLPSLPLAARSYQLRVRGMAGGEERRRFSIKKGQHLKLKIELPPGR